MPHSLVQPTEDASKSTATWVRLWDLSKNNRNVESNYEIHWSTDCSKITKKQVVFTSMSS